MGSNSCYYRAVAVDYDGTLTFAPSPSVEVLEAVRAARATGLKIVLVTGRILSELRADFPDLDGEFDGIVAENGAVIWTVGSGERVLVSPVGADLEETLMLNGVPHRRGRVILATESRYDRLVLRAISAARGDYQLAYNRDALMILPTGVSKGRGLFEVLGELGISHHSVVALGDAENDHSLVEFCELGVAVANAVPSLQLRADIVLHESDGQGVVELLQGPLLRGDIRVRPKRWQVEVGAGPGGVPVMVPGSQTNLLIVGGSGSGKSYLAGLLVERLSAKGYCTCVLDPEGDHVTLANLRGVIAVGGASGMPTPERLAELLTQRFGSVVIDMSRLSAAEKLRQAETYVKALQTLRRETGLPHWIVIDEAPQLMGMAGAIDACGPASQGFCLVTHEPGTLPRSILDQMDLVFAVPGGEQLLAELQGVPAARGVEHGTDRLRRGEALLFDAGERVRFTMASRHRPHVRHWHKYLSNRLPPSGQFFFRTPKGPTGGVVGNVAEFHHELERASEEVLRHHLMHGDFSRWLEQTLQDRALAVTVGLIESGYQNGTLPDLEGVRQQLIDAVEQRYGVPS